MARDASGRFTTADPRTLEIEESRQTYLRDAVRALGKGDQGKAAFGLLVFSTWCQLQSEGYADLPTLMVSVRS